MNNELEAQLRKRIMAAMPLLTIHTVRLVTEGFDSDAVIVNDAWVFRFPRRPDVAAQLAVEQALLPALAARLPIAIPHFEIGVAAGDDLLPFVGYRLLPGTQMRAEHVRTLSVAQRDALAAQLGAFLSALHTFPVESVRSIAPAMRVTERDPVMDERAAVERDVFPLLTPAEQRWAHALYAEVSDPQIWHWTPVVTHNDLNTDHILFDPHTQRIGGIIDWGDMELGDPANDFAALFEYGQPFMETVLQHYTLPADAAFRLRMRSLLPRTIFGNLRYLVQQDHQSGIARNLRELRERTTARNVQEI